LNSEKVIEFLKIKEKEQSEAVSESEAFGFI